MARQREKRGELGPGPAWLTACHRGEGLSTPCWEAFLDEDTVPVLNTGRSPQVEVGCIAAASGNAVAKKSRIGAPRNPLRIMASPQFMRRAFRLIGTAWLKSLRPERRKSRKKVLQKLSAVCSRDSRQLPSQSKSAREAGGDKESPYSSSAGHSGMSPHISMRGEHLSAESTGSPTECRTAVRKRPTCA